MGVTNTNAYDGPFYPNGVTTSFPFTFRTMSTNEVQIVDDDGEILTGFSFSIVPAVGEDGGTIIFDAPPTAQQLPAFLIASAPNFGVGIDLGSVTAFNPRTLNPSFERLAVQNIFLADRVERAPKLPFAGAAFIGRYSYVRPDGTWGFSNGTGADAGLREDLEEDGAPLVSFFQAGGGAGYRLVRDELRETVKISQFYAGGASDSTALQRAYAKLTDDAAGGIIELDVRAYGDPYLIDALAIAELSASGINPITIRGKGLATTIQVASACDHFFTFNAAWGGLENVLILDPNGYCEDAYIYIEPTTGFPSRERFFRGLKVIGPGDSSTAFMFENNGGQKLRMSYLDAQNVEGLFRNIGGGVDSTIDQFYALGTKFGIVLDANEDYGHAENFKATCGTLLCTQADARGIKITDALHVGFADVICGQLGVGGIGLEFAAGVGEGAVFTELVNCYLEGSNGGPAIKSRGVNREFKMIGGGFGQGGYDASLIDCIDMDGAANFVFDGTGANFPLSDCNKIATFANSSGTITETNKGWELATNTSTEVACDIDWGLREDHGLPAARLTTSSYPNGNWSPWTPTVTPGSGAFTTLGAPDCAYRRTGKTVDVRISIPITTNGTAAGIVFATLPINAKAGKKFVLAGSENGATGKAVQGIVNGNGVTIKFTDGTYPGANAAVLVLSGTYEVG